MFDREAATEMGEVALGTTAYAVFKLPVTLGGRQVFGLCGPRGGDTLVVDYGPGRTLNVVGSLRGRVTITRQDFAPFGVEA